MLNYELQMDDAILVLKPDGPLTADDFAAPTRRVDAYLGQYRTLRGVMVYAKSFSGWQDFGALLAHLEFVRRHHQRIEKVAIVADGAVASVMPRIANHFVRARTRHFLPHEEGAAWHWLTETSAPGLRTAA